MTGSDAVTREQVLERLRAVKGPDRGEDIVSLGLVSDVAVNGGKVYFSISVDPARARELEPMRLAAENTVKAMQGVEHAVVSLTAHAGQGREAPAQPRRQQPGAQPGGQPGKAGVPGIGAIVAVASGKGGVGKSTVAINLALGLKENGLRVGLLDADIYGPSVPRLTGLSGKPEQVDERTMAPKEAFGLKLMSIGFLVEEDTPMIWRGPMVISALTQMLRQVAWGELDVLVVDMPPGTGDAQLTMAQQVPLAGAVIVSTPQDLALIDARKGIAMFRKVDVPILGLIENMSYFLCPHCGERTEIFGHGGAEAEAARLGVAYLGGVPLDMAIRETSDAGTPVVASAPQSPYAEVFRRIAERVWQEAEAATAGAGEGPRIVME